MTCADISLGWCPQDLASKHWRVEFQGPLCSAEDLDFAFCPRVSYGIGWHCMNSIPCTMKTLAEEVPSTTVSTVVELIPVTFRVGMVNEVSTAGVHLAGSFQSWDPSATPMNLNQAGTEVVKNTCEQNPWVTWIKSP